MSTCARCDCAVTVRNGCDWDDEDLCNDCVRDVLESTQADRARAEQQRDALLKAAKAAATWIGTGNPSADYDAAADRFFADTGLIAPGRDVAAAAGRDDDNERRVAWDKWAAANRDRTRALVRAAIQAAEREEKS